MFLSPRNSNLHVRSGPHKILNLHVSVHENSNLYVSISNKFELYVPIRNFFESPRSRSQQRSSWRMLIRVGLVWRGGWDTGWVWSAWPGPACGSSPENLAAGKSKHNKKKDKNDANKKGIKDIKWAGITKTRDFNNQKGTTYDPAPGSWHWMFNYRVIIKFWFVICQGELHKKFYLLLLYKWKIGSAKSDNLFLLKCFLYQLFSQIIIKSQISNKINVFFIFF